MRSTNRIPGMSSSTPPEEDGKLASGVAYALAAGANAQRARHYFERVSSDVWPAPDAPSMTAVTPSWSS